MLRAFLNSFVICTVFISSLAIAERPDLLWLKGRSQLYHVWSPYTNNLTEAILAFSPDGTLFALATPWCVEVRRAADQTLVFTLPNRSMEAMLKSPDPMAIFFTRDGRGIVTQEERTSFRYWNVSDGTLLNTLRSEDSSASVSPDGRFMVETERPSGSPVTSMRVRRVRDGALMVARERVRTWTFSPVSDTLAVVLETSAVQLLNPEDGSLRREVAGSAFPAEAFQNVMSVSLSPDGSVLAAAMTDRVDLYRLDDGSLIQSLQNLKAAQYSEPPRFSPDGQLLGTFGIGRGFVFWRRDNGQWVPAFPQYDGSRDFLFSPDGRFLATPGRENNVAKVWRTSDEQLVHVLAQGQPIAFSPDSDLLAILSPTPMTPFSTIFTDPFSYFSYYPITLWRVSTGLQVVNPGRFSGATALAFSPDGRTMAVAGTEIQLYDAITGDLLSVWPKGEGNYYLLRFGEDGQTLISETHEWRVSDGKLLRRFPRININDPVSPNGQFYAATSSYPRPPYPVRIYRTADSSIVNTLSLEGSDYIISPLAFTPDSEALLVSIYNGRWDEGGSIYSYELWSVSTGKFLRTVARADPYSRALSDGRTLAVQLKRIDSASSTQVVTLRVYDVAEAKLLHSASHPSPGKDSNGAFISPFLRLDVKQHPPNYEATAFADMKKNVYLTFNAPDRSLQLWELTTGRLLQTFRLQEEDPDPAYTGVSAQVSLDGKTVMLKSATRVSLWRVEDGSRVANYDQEVSGMRLLTFSLDSRLMAYIESNGALAVAINPVKGGFVLGDVDTDGTVNVRDAILTLRFITELASPTPREKQAADLSGDSIISVTDVILILRKAVGLNPTL